MTVVETHTDSMVLAVGHDDVARRDWTVPDRNPCHG